MRLFMLAAMMIAMAPEDGEPKGGGAVPVPPISPAAGPPIVPPDGKGKPATPPATPSPAPPAAASGGDGPKRIGDDDEIPETADLVSLSPGALKKRLARASKGALREAFGTDDVAEVQAKIKRADELEKAEEERRRLQLSSEEKLKEDVAREKSRADSLEKRLEIERWEREKSAVEARTAQVATRFVKNKAACQRAVMLDLKDHVAGLSDSEAESFGESQMEAWIKNWASENPEFALAPDAPPPPAPPPAHPGARLSLGAGTTPPASPTPPGGVGKTAKVGQPNSFTDDEWKAEKKRIGLSY